MSAPAVEQAAGHRLGTMLGFAFGCVFIAVVLARAFTSSSLDDRRFEILRIVLALAGADDPFQKPDDLAAFEKEMRDAKVDWQINFYGGAVHAFTQPMAGNDNSKGAAYNAKADRRSWEEMKRFFAEIFG